MSSPAKPDLADVLPRLNDMMREDDHWGDVAAYIPQLAKVDPAQFGIAVVTADGQCHVAGDTQVPFSVQSITKVFTLAIALGRSGDQLWHRVGREPSGRRGRHPRWERAADQACPKPRLGRTPLAF